MIFSRFTFTMVLWLAAIGIALGQTRFTTNVSANKIAKNEFLQISFEVVNGDVENFEQPAFPGWQVVGGPNVSSGVIITNGQKTTNTSYQFYLKPNAPGTYTIAGAKAQVDGKVLASNPVIITVSAKDADNPQGLRPSHPSSLFPNLDDLLEPREEPADNFDGYVLKEGEDATEKTKANLFILVDVSKKSCYEGEPIIATYQLYTRVSLNAHITKRPSFSGFSSIDLADNVSQEYELKQYKGKQYRVYTIRKVQLYPLQAGMLTLQPAEIDATVQYKRVPSLQNMQQYDPYSPDNVVNLSYTVKGEPVTINVAELPAAGKPAGFTGAVGDFSIATSVAEAELARNQAGVYKVEITGKGNWAMLQAPEIKWPNGVEVYEPTVTENLDSQATPVSGKRVYEYAFLYTQPGSLKLPDVQVSFFDPARQQYQSVTAPGPSVEILDKLLPQSELQDYDPGGPTDFTQMFTDLVKVVFPLMAVGLLLWLFMKSRKRRSMRRHEEVWQRLRERNLQLEREMLAKENAAAASESNPTPPPPISDTSKYQPVFNASMPAATPPVVAHVDTNEEAPTVVPEPQERQVVLSKEYFTAVKKDLMYLLQWHWQVHQPSIAGIKKELLAKNMLAEDAESISMLLEACDKHIYSPFSESINKKEWDSIVAEIHFVLKKEKK